MAEERQRRNSKDRDREDHSNDVRLRLMKKEPEKLMLALNTGKMAAVLSGMEVMYVFIFRNQYMCFIHKFNAEDGRYKGWEINERNTAMIKNLTVAADNLFEITPKKDMDPMGVMVAAEQGIISYLDATGQLPAEDTDFMSWQNAGEEG